MTYYEAKHIVGKKVPDFSRTVLIEGGKNGGEKRVYNTVTYEHYNLKRKKKKFIKIGIRPNEDASI